MSIAWDTTGIEGDVQIGLRSIDGPHEYSLENSYPHDGSPYNYIISGKIAPGMYIIRVRQTPINGISGTFSILSESATPISPPTATLLTSIDIVVEDIIISNTSPYPLIIVLRNDGNAFTQLFQVNVAKIKLPS